MVLSCLTIFAFSVQLMPKSSLRYLKSLSLSFPGTLSQQNKYSFSLISSVSKFPISNSLSSSFDSSLHLLNFSSQQSHKVSLTVFSIRCMKVSTRAQPHPPKPILNNFLNISLYHLRFSFSQ